MIKQVITTTALVVLLSGCETMFAKLDNVGKEPAFEVTRAPLKKEAYRPIQWPGDDEEIKHKKTMSNSLWQPESRMFFKDQKARRIGDILKVNVKITGKAELDNTTESTRSNRRSANAGGLFGLEGLLTGWLPGKANPAELLDINTSNSNSGEGTVDREEKIETEVAAIVTQILPNGNLVIHGDQEVRVNFELRKITVSGIVRPEDISSQNSVDSNLIAEARISYGGRGQLTDAQQPPIGHQVVDALSPF